MEPCEVKCPDVMCAMYCSGGFEKNKEYIKIGIRRLELESEFSNKELEKVKKRKTSNKSKKDHDNTYTPNLFN